MCRFLHKVEDVCFYVPQCEAQYKLPTHQVCYGGECFCVVLALDVVVLDSLDEFEKVKELHGGHPWISFWIHTENKYMRIDLDGLEWFRSKIRAVEGSFVMFVMTSCYPIGRKG